MLWLRKPSAEEIQEFLRVQAALGFTYAAVGATAETPPGGYVVDHTRTRLGEGEALFGAAKAALQRWDQFRLSWLEVTPPQMPLTAGQVVAILARACGLWWLNACRIVHVVDDGGAVSRFGVAYGTLPGHVGTGEERLLVEWHRSDNSVWYDILAFSRPHHVLARLGYPVVRRMQKRFGRESSAAMLRALQHAGSQAGRH